MSLLQDTRYLTGFRGIAALAVVVSHMANEGLLPQVLGAGLGRVGVGAFFVLSGYLMAGLYLDRPASEMRGYLVARLSRVLPLYWLVLTASWAGTHAGLGWVMEIHDFEFLESALLFRAPDIFWTIPVEIHYYAIFALLWLLHDRAGKGAFLAATAALAVACQGLSLYIETHVSYYNRYLHYWLAFFAAGTLFGAGGAEAAASLRAAYLRVRILAGPLCLLLVLWSVPGLRRAAGALPPESVPDSWNSPAAWAGIAAGFVLATAEPAVTRALSRPALQWLGTVSYSLYLTHYLVLAAVIGQLAPQTLPGRAAAALLVLAGAAVLATALTRWVEMPARAALRRLAMPRAAAA